MYQSLLALDNVRLNFSADNASIINIALILMMFGVALDLQPSHFKHLIQNPQHILAGFMSQAIILPAATFGLVMLLGRTITEGVALGMLLVAACPGGNISNFITSYAKGNVALAVSLTALSTLLAVFFTPFNFTFWGNLYVQSNQLVRPLTLNWQELLKTVFLLLGLPLSLGMACAYYKPTLAQKLLKPFRVFSLIFFGALVAIAFYKNLDVIVKHIHYVFIVVLIHNVLALVTGYGMGTVFGLSKNNCRTLSIETGIHNSGLGLALLFNPAIFPASLPLGGMTIVAAWWGIWHIVSGLFFAHLWRNNHA
jgi:bile acid:Na+ symporter, BASS family